MSFKNKVILITGGSAGIGAVTAEQFAKEGANIAIVGRNETRLNEVMKCCEKFGANTLAIKADIGNDEDAKIIVSKTVEKFGKVDVLVNNAAVFKVAKLSTLNMIDIYDELTRVNLRAAILLTSLAAPYLIKTKGNVVNISSAAGQTYCQNPEWMMYGLAKTALNFFSGAAALELGSSGVRVNLVTPGPVRTRMLEVDVAVSQDEIAEFTVLNRISEPEEVADMIMFLASDKAKGVTGSNFTVDNGVLVKY